MKENTLKIEYIPINELKEYENNAKLHPQEQIDQIKKSIVEFGMNDPIAIWKNNVIIEGHGRLMACKELNIKEVPIIRLDDLTDDQRKAYTLIHNQTTMNTGFDLDILQEELANIDLDMSDFGFDIGVFDSDEYGTVFELPDGEKGNIEQMTFTLSGEQATLIRSALDMVKDEINETFGNENKNGNAIYEVVRQWAELKK